MIPSSKTLVQQVLNRVKRSAQAVFAHDPISVLAISRVKSRIRYSL
jgi:hypothetical protein